MEAWRVLVYEVGVDSKMRASDFMELTASSKIKLLMSKSSEETFVKDFKTHLMPFLRNIGKKNFSRRQDLLHKFMVEIAKTDLICVLKLLEQCSPEVSDFYSELFYICDHIKIKFISYIYFYHYHYFHILSIYCLKLFELRWMAFFFNFAKYNCKGLYIYSCIIILSHD